ncbi:hypothetical protein [Streptomyces zaomyceticus]|uniref:hypothetical protein n=1 Tax=Streptomyces zaomyceticus TaxID=68286 RepID=UPI0037AF4EFF
MMDYDVTAESALQEVRTWILDQQDRDNRLRQALRTAIDEVPNVEVAEHHVDRPGATLDHKECVLADATDVPRPARFSLHSRDAL